MESFLQQDQKVQIIARSIVDTSGFSLKSSILELQAIVVYVGSDIDMPLTIPRPHKYTLTTLPSKSYRNNLSNFLLKMLILSFLSDVKLGQAPSAKMSPPLGTFSTKPIQLLSIKAC
jgi:hypothetical protein